VTRVKILRRTVRVDKPVRRVYDYLADFENTEEWDAGTVRTTRTSGDGGVGTTYRNISRFLGKDTELTYVVVALEEGRTIALRGENKTVVAHDTMRLSGDDQHTEVEYTAEFEFQGLARYLEPLLTFPLKRLGDEAEDSLKIALSKL
jgi:uncharacterized protein YndB with AHSA1/START domain